MDTNSLLAFIQSTFGPKDLDCHNKLSANDGLIHIKSYEMFISLQKELLAKASAEMIQHMFFLRTMIKSNRFNTVDKKSMGCGSRVRGFYLDKLLVWNHNANDKFPVRIVLLHE